MANKNKKKNASKSKPKPVKSKSAQQTVAVRYKASVPKVSFKNTGVCMITHTEYVTDIVSQASDSLMCNLRINPQSADTFTWLSAFALRFEQYKFHSLKFMYKPSVATTKDGYVVIATDFDVYDEAPVDKATMLAWRMAKKGAVWQEVTLDVSQEANSQGYKYCDVSTRGDARLDDLGKLYAYGGTGSAVTCGELYVSYTVEFRQPAIKGSISKYWTMDPRIAITATDYFGQTVTDFNSLKPNGVRGNITPEWAASNKIKIVEPGDYMVSLNMTASSGLSTVPTLTVTAPVTAPNSTYSTPITNGGTFNAGGTIGNASWFFSLFSGEALLTIGAFVGSGVLVRLQVSSYKNS